MFCTTCELLITTKYNFCVFSSFNALLRSLNLTSEEDSQPNYPIGYQCSVILILTFLVATPCSLSNRKSGHSYCKGTS